MKKKFIAFLKNNRAYYPFMENAKFGLRLVDLYLFLDNTKPASWISSAFCWTIDDTNGFEFWHGLDDEWRKIVKREVGNEFVY